MKKNEHSLELLQAKYEKAESLFLKLQIAEELGGYGDRRGRHLAIRALLQEEDSRIRETAVRTLGVTCRREDISLVKAVWEDPCESVAVLMAAWEVLPDMEFSALSMPKKWELLTAALFDDGNPLPQ
ncbi:MAG: hypothetical protein COB53_00840 [Elusimicrobia bacterium]|nr:MAG: hypothetical protein COB53_00840 [Elusimicrobiota bacterium]